MKVKKIALDKLFSAPAWDSMIEEYTEECANFDLSSGGQVDKERYYTLEKAGVMDVLGVYENSGLVGFATVLLTPVPHFSKTVAVTESLFLRKDYRTGPNGLKLVGAVKELAKERGADGVYFSTPKGSAFERLCQVMRLVETNKCFYMRLGDE